MMLICHVCDLLDSLYSMGDNNCIIYAINNISMSQYSVLWTINGIMILVAQPLIRPIIVILRGNLKHQMFVGIFIL